MAIPATGTFPYPHRTLEQASTADPVKWREANRPIFDAIYGPGELLCSDGRRNPQMGTRRSGMEFARRWRAENKPQFDALYGPDEWAEERARRPAR